MKKEDFDLDKCVTVVFKFARFHSEKTIREKLGKINLGLQGVIMEIKDLTKKD